MTAGRLALSEALGWAPEDFDSRFDELTAKGLALADWEHRVVLVPDAAREARATSPNVVTAWVNGFRDVPQCDLRDQAIRILGDVVAGTGVAQPLLDAFADILAEGKPDGNEDGKGLGVSEGKADPNNNQTSTTPEPVTEQNLTMLSPAAPALSAEAVMLMWNAETKPPIPRCAELTSTRRKHAEARLRERGLDGLRTVFKRINANGFYRGQNDRGWSPNFDWALKPSNIVKVLEGAHVGSVSHGARRPGGLTGAAPPQKYSA